MELDNLTKLQNELEQQKRNEEEAIKVASVGGESVELTDEEKARIDSAAKSRQIVVSSTGQNGTSKDVDLVEYAKGLDDRVIELGKAEGMEQMLKAINSGDIVKSAESIKSEAREQAIQAFKKLAVNDQNISDDEYITINNQAIACLQQHFGMNRLDSEVLLKKLYRLRLKEICDILPPEFTEIYVTKSELEANNSKAKERLLATIGYLVVTGPELDYLNDYIDTENKLVVVSQRLLQCQVDFADMIKDERTMSQIIADTIDLCPVDTSFWSKYIKQPNRVHNEFAQRVVIQEKYREAYLKILDDYPVILLEEYVNDPDALAEHAKEAAFNEKARAMIQAEITEAENKIAVYKNVTDMQLLKERWPLVVERFGPNAKGKKLDMNYLLKEALAAIDRIRRCRQDLPFPGYNGSKRPEDIFQAFIQDYSRMIINYNHAIHTVADKEPDRDMSAYLIHVDGVPDDATAVVFSISIALLMGRVTKALTKNDATKYDAIMLDAYFQLFCRMGLDIYIMQDVWAMVKDFVKYVIDTYYRPQLTKELDDRRKKATHRIPKKPRK